MVSVERSRWPRSWRTARRAGWILAASAVLLAAPLGAQQTIFNVPSTEVLDKRQAYVELDVLGHEKDPGSVELATRTAYGLGGEVEAGLNLDGFEVPGRSVPALHPTVKWSPWHDERMAFVTGALGVFFLRGNRDGSPGILWYGEGSYELPTDTKLTAGGYWASSGYAAPDPQAGALLALEQKIGEHLELVADWVSGENDLGYVTPGVSVKLDPWALQLGYSIKNGDSSRNGILFQVQAKF